MAFSYTIDLGEGPVNLTYGPFVDAEGIGHPANVLDLWSDDELSEIGVVKEDEGPERRLIPKSTVQERVNDAGKLATVFGILQAPGNEIYYARWFAPDWPNVYFDDEGLITILSAAGCTPTQIATITA